MARTHPSLRLPAASPPTEPCEPSLTEAPLGEPCASDLAEVFRALGDPIRLRLLSIVTSAAPDEVCACNLATPVDRSPATVSHHMSVLRRAGLITSEKRGILVFYRVVPERFEELVRLLQLPHSSVGPVLVDQI